MIISSKIQQFFLLALLVFNFSEAQNILSGTVVDKATSEPVIGAVIKTNSLGAVTDEIGKFSLSLPEGVQTIKVEYFGYKTVELQILIRPNENMILDIRLESSNVLLDVAEISSSRFEKPIAESPISIDVIQARTADRLNSIAADQVIDKVPGVQIIDGQANIRGGSGYSYGAGSRVMLIMDDLQILQPDAAFTNWSDLPLENVGQIEILKGAASALYGSAAMNGVIHFRNIKPSLDPYTSISYASRVYMEPSAKNHWWNKDSNQVIPSDNVLTFAHRRKFRKFDIVAGGMYRNEVSYNKGKGVENYRVNGSAVYHFTDRLIAGLAANINTGNSTNFFYWKSNGSYEGDLSSYSASKRTRFNIDPSFQYFTKNNYKIRFLSRWLHINNNNDNNQSNKSENIFTELQLQKKLDRIGLEFASGIVFNYFSIDAPLFSDSIFKSNNIGIYTQLEQTIFRTLKLSAGVRYEYNRLNGPSEVNGEFIQNPVVDDRPVFRLGMNYQIRQSTYIRSSFGQGFRFPSLAEKYIQTNAGGFNIIPNIDLNSEHGNSYEIGIKQGIKWRNYQGLVDISYFDSRYQDMIEFTLVINKFFQAFYQAQNVGNVRIKGVEITNQGILDFGKSKITYNAGITFLDPKFQEFDITGKDLSINNLDSASRGQKNALASSSSINVLKYRSKELARIDIEYQFKKIFAGVNFTYASHVEAIDFLFESGLFINGVKEFRRSHNQGYRLYDFRVGYQFKQLGVQLNVQNAFNEVYTLRPGIMEAPRSIGGRITYSITNG
ncbi:MAG: TonB-dependent receptor [Saprospiraceae bacterium]|nr:TonB-dependent receptor [Saprospiraceae bacterium]